MLVDTDVDVVWVVCWWMCMLMYVYVDVVCVGGCMCTVC